MGGGWNRLRIVFKDVVKLLTVKFSPETVDLTKFENSWYSVATKLSASPYATKSTTIR
jgi:hypothetical protein